MVKIYNFSLFEKDYFFAFNKYCWISRDFNIIEDNCSRVRMNKVIILVWLMQSQDKSVPLLGDNLQIVFYLLLRHWIHTRRKWLRYYSHPLGRYLPCTSCGEKLTQCMVRWYALPIYSLSWLQFFSLLYS